MTIINAKILKKIIADFNCGRGKCLQTIQKELLESGAGNLSIYILRQIVYTPEFRGVIIHSSNGGQLPNQEALDMLFPNCGVKHRTVKKWVINDNAARRSSFDPVTLTQNLLIITEPFIHRIKNMFLDSKRFFRPKQILVQLEKEDNRPYSRSVLDKVGRTLFFHHLVSPWTFHYFLETTSEDWHKVGRCRDFTSRVNPYFTILLGKATIKLLLRYPTVHELKVDKWFKDKYLDYKVEIKESNFVGKKKDAGEFYKSCVLDLFLNSEDHTILLKGKNGEDFTVKLEKVLPGSSLFESIVRNLKFLYKLRVKNRDMPRNAAKGDIECEIHPDIANHPSLVDYRLKYRDVTYVKTDLVPHGASRVVGLRKNAVVAMDAREVDMRAREATMVADKDALIVLREAVTARENALVAHKDPSLK